ncbi:MAG: TIGR04283 family arsenosugar biosynthesis glycosyltransferase [Desulfuromonadales bacterium]|nr:TIGR04283 family arsenosugar biosynthesis glycosyltransferase [Desulfuromonadales bacterium]
MMRNLKISVIIPTLNEQQALPLLLADLAAQQGVSLHIIISDGGSRDATCALAEQCCQELGLSLQLVRGEAGRGGQLNRGAKGATSDWLLFLHADSRLPDSSQLAEAVQRLSDKDDDVQSAGRFRLRFSDAESLAYQYYEIKAQLGRAGCIHGDQGFLLRRDFFNQVGPFREDLPVMEDTLLAERIRDCGSWLLLPGEIITSARRFEREGLAQRQTLNALMMNFAHIGWFDFFEQAPALYRQQDKTQTLQLRPFFDLIATLLAAMPLKERWRIWLDTGAYVRSQFWQLGLALDVKRTAEAGVAAGSVPMRWLKRVDRWFDPLTDNCIGRLVATLLVRGWFFVQKHG